MMTDLLEPVRPASSATEMRVELFRLGHYNPMIRAVFDMADYHGLSAEDKYTMLAYAAISQLVALQSHLVLADGVCVHEMVEKGEQ